MTTMLEFYQQHAISPVRQVIPDQKAHFTRRAHLYRSLGLAPIAIRGKAVLEVGPGDGCNALYTASLGPADYVLLEPNATAADHLRARFGDRDNVLVLNRRLEECVSGPGFSVVLCEGLLGLCGSDPKALLELLVTHVKPGGVLVITCIDPISDCAEVLRRAMAHRLVDKTSTLEKQLQALRPVFIPHLATLKGMTRSVDDWIVDNLLNPASIGSTFSIPEALEQLDGRFEVLGCSPRCLLDWRWYKDTAPGNAWAIESYWRNAHNLIDYREVRPAVEPQINKGLMRACAQLRMDVQLLEQGHPVTVRTSSVENDIGWFGRGQQYLSLVRVDAE